MYQIYFTFIFILLVSHSRGFLTAEQESYLESLIHSQILQHSRVPGFGIAIVKETSEAGDSSSYIQGYGFSDLENEVDIANSTKFLIASISKSFTATVTSNFLFKEFPQYGESVLDIPIAQLVPSYNFTLSDRFRTKQITFRDLLSHRTCLNSYGLGVTAGAYSTREERIRRMRYIQEKCGVRSRFEYSNNMFILAGDVVAHLSGIPFDDMVRSFMSRLEMRDSLIMDNVTDYEALLGMSRGYYLEPDGILRKMNAELYNGNSGAAAGGVISTLKDMVNYLKFHLQDGAFSGEQIVPKDIMQWLRTPSNHMDFTGWRTDRDTDNSDMDFAYGLALNIGSYRGWQRISHEGDLSPFTSHISLYPAKKLGVFTFSNGPGPLEPEYGHQLVRNEIFDMLFPSPGSREKVLQKKKQSVNIQKDIPEKDKLSSRREEIDPGTIAGLYGHPYEGTFIINYNASNETFPLAIQYGKRGSGILLETEESNIYLLQFFGDIVSQLYAYNGGRPLSEIKLDFNTPDIALYSDSDGIIEYKKNMTLDTLPDIPWDEFSCGPEK